jgi:cobalt-zinc-cadmium efflux system outer membrane protein
VSRAAFAAVVMTVLASAGIARAQGDGTISLEEALRAARAAAPDLVVARTREGVARAEVGIAGTYPNPSVAVGTSTQAAKLSGTLTLPLVVLGQRGASIDAARAEESTVRLDTQVSWNDVRQATTRAYVALWLAEGAATAKRDAAAIEATLEASVIARVQVGAAPQLDALRVHAEKLRADADVLEATALVSSARTELGRWMGLVEVGNMRTTPELPVVEAPTPLAALAGRVGGSVAVRREESDVRASEAREARERALVRPGLSLDVGLDAFDPTLLPPTAAAGSTPPINYRAQLAIEVPLFNQRGAYVEREKAQRDVARARVQAARIQGAAELTAAYRTYEAATAQQHTLALDVVPAAAAAAKATVDAYTLGRAQLVAVLDAERALVDARVSALEAQAKRADAWADVEHAVGTP